MCRFLLAVGFLVNVAGPGFAADDPFDQSKVPLEVKPPADFKGKRILLAQRDVDHGQGWPFSHIDAC